jgi:hypothetical protein
VDGLRGPGRARQRRAVEQGQEHGELDDRPHAHRARAPGAGPLPEDGPQRRLRRGPRAALHGPRRPRVPAQCPSTRSTSRPTGRRRTF